MRLEVLGYTDLGGSIVSKYVAVEHTLKAWEAAPTVAQLRTQVQRGFALRFVS
jgi:hypothetical protein